MAQCYSCGQEIPYFSMGIGIFKCFRRNFYRKTLPVFNCPHCSIECQETARTVYSFLLLFVIALIGGLWFVRSRHISISNDLAYFTVCLSVYFVLHYLWWKFVSKLKEPYIFWWENK
jgi:hypothetical protein